MLRAYLTCAKFEVLIIKMNNMKTMKNVKNLKNVKNMKNLFFDLSELLPGGRNARKQDE